MGVTIKKMSKVRLDVMLVERGLAESRSQAQRLVMAGQVRVNGQVALKPSVYVTDPVLVEVSQPPLFVSRGGEKLQAALDAFALSPHDALCADVGASTGGFTDCLLQRGARRVYAIDVGQGILHWKLRNDPRLVVMEGVNARHVVRLPEAVDWVVIDASFISLKILLPVVMGWFDGEPPAGQVIALIKPQFEVGRRLAARGDGVIRDPAAHRQVLLELLAFAQSTGYTLRGLIRSPLLGPKGNAEFLAWLSLPPAASAGVEALVASILPEGAPPS
jgi:23S rRNA (cytidine1920-2'-O)/16S rRNA (cytidine1409-2'-O)-methyltransferase